MSRPSAKRSTARMWAAKSSPPMRVSTSPTLKAEASEPVTDTRPTPARHSRAAATLNRSGRCFATAQLRKGTATQYTAVKKAFFPGVV